MGQRQVMRSAIREEDKNVVDQWTIAAKFVENLKNNNIDSYFRGGSDLFSVPKI
jgi:hypothetical protein